MGNQFCDIFLFIFYFHRIGKFLQISFFMLMIAQSRSRSRDASVVITDKYVLLRGRGRKSRNRHNIILKNNNNDSDNDYQCCCNQDHWHQKPILRPPFPPISSKLDNFDGLNQNVVDSFDQERLFNNFKKFNKQNKLFSNFVKNSKKKVHKNY